MDMNLNELWELVMDREVWLFAVYEVAKSWTWLSNWTELNGCWQFDLWFLCFLKSSLNIWKFLVHILLKTGLENFEHYFGSMWNECNCAVVWTFFGIAFLWDWNENWPFPVLWPCRAFLIGWHTECSTLSASSFRTWIAHLEFLHLHSFVHSDVS